jgi:hypothetical protein
VEVDEINPVERFYDTFIVKGTSDYIRAVSLLIEAPSQFIRNELRRWGKPLVATLLEAERA